MDDVLKRRVIGALALMAVAFLLSLLLPRPEPGGYGADGTRVVTLPLGDAASDESAGIPAPGDAQADAPSSGSSGGRALDLAIAPETAVAEQGPDDASAEPDIQSPPAEEVPFEATEPPPPESIPEAPAEAVSPPKPAPQPAAKPAPEPATKPAVAPPSKPTPAAVARAVPKAEAKPQKPPEKKAEPIPEPPAIVVPKTALPSIAALPPKPSSRWSLQAGAYADIGNAHQVEAKIRALGYAAVISPAETGSGIRYRVRSGPYTSREQADAARVKLQQSGIKASLVEDGG